MSPPLSTNRATKWEWTQLVLLGVNLVWTTLCLGGYSPETMIVTGALTCALVAVHLLSRVFVEARRAHPAGWLLLPFLIYAAGNAQWITPVRWLGWRDWMGWAQLIAIFWVVLNGLRAPAVRRALFGILLGLSAVTVALACYQHFVRPDWLMLGRIQADQFIARASGSFGIPNSLAALLLLFIPVAGALSLSAGRPATRWGWGAFCVFLSLGLELTISRGAWLGLALALTIWPLASTRWSWRRRIGASIAVVAGLAACGAALFLGSTRVHERLLSFVHDAGETSRPILWRGAWQLWREHPIFGSGAGSFNVLFEKYRPEKFLNDPQWAHNDYLNTLSDYGAVGFALFFGAVVVIGGRCLLGRETRVNAPSDGLNQPLIHGALSVGLLAFALQLFVDFHFKIPALAMVFAAVSALVVQSTWPTSDELAPESLPVRAGMIMGAATVLAFGAFVVVPHFRAEALRLRSRHAIERLAVGALDPDVYRAVLVTARRDLADAVAIDEGNAQAWADISYADSLWAHVESAQTMALGVSAENAANRALALSHAPGEFWTRRAVALDMQNRWSEASEVFAHVIELAPQTAIAWYYYAYHLSLNPRRHDLAEAAVNFCLRLDPGNEAGLALRHRLAISSKAP